MRLTRGLLSGALALTCAMAQAQYLPAPARIQPPSETDLAAAYCFGMAKLAGQAMAPQMQRLRGYLAPRFQFVDSEGLMTASRQAEMDVAADLASCSSASGCQPSMQAKIARCKTLEFLPY